MTAVTRFAPAKVNLYLHVTGRRADGYHLLDSLVVFAGAGDRLSFSPAGALTLSLSGPGAADLDNGPDNIVLRAARALAHRLGRPAQAAIHLEKNLPVASGIGGGSADAAATLRGLLDLWQADLADADLADLGLGLGADLPVCLAGRPAQMAGIGEILAPAVALPPAWLLLVNPRRALSTPAVFQSRAAGFRPAAPLIAPPGDAAALATHLRDRGNDLAAAAIALQPAIAQILAALAASPDCLLARMSGSGATCFGLYGQGDHAEAAAARMMAEHPDWWVAPAAILP